jgi:hypothetical protein
MKGRTTMKKRASEATQRVPSGPIMSPKSDPRDVEIARLLALVSELTEQNELLQEAIRRLQTRTAETAR